MSASYGTVQHQLRTPFGRAPTRETPHAHGCDAGRGWFRSAVLAPREQGQHRIELAAQFIELRAMLAQRGAVLG